MGLGSFGFVLGLPRSIRIGLRVKSFHGGILGVGVLACSCGLRRFPECPRLPQNLPYGFRIQGLSRIYPSWPLHTSVRSTAYIGVVE